MLEMFSIGTIALPKVITHIVIVVAIVLKVQLDALTKKKVKKKTTNK
jgi:hypothetical protein